MGGGKVGQNSWCVRVGREMENKKVSISNAGFAKKKKQSTYFSPFSFLSCFVPASFSKFLFFFFSLLLIPGIICGAPCGLVLFFFLLPGLARRRKQAQIFFLFSCGRFALFLSRHNCFPSTNFWSSLAHY